MGHLLWLCQFLLLHLFSLHFQVASSLAAASSAPVRPLDQCTALLEFKNAFSIDKSASFVCDFYHGIASYPKTESWNKTKHCCLWDGVTCDKLTSNVIGLDLSCSWLRGAFHSDNTIFFLPQLQKLNLAYNDFRLSPISPDFGGFRNLTHLNLSNTSFSGQIPSEISCLSKLISIDFSKNCHQLRLGRSTWRRLVQNLTELRELSLDQVNMDSIVPISLINLSSSLTSLSLNDCNLQGKFPANILRLRNLQELRLSNSEVLTGYFPKSNWSNSLRLLDLSYSGLSGELPDSIGSLRNLEQLNLKGCNFTGPIPTSLGNLTKITFLDLSSNNITGEIPSSFSNLEQLTNLDLSSNSLIGQIPNVFSKLRKLVILSLSRNNFQGHLPSSAFNLLEISFMDFSRNQLEGPIPSQATKLSYLTELWLTDNSLNGSVPSWIFALPSLKFLDFSFNQLTGHLLEFHCKSVEFINMGNNKLHGSIPGSIFELVNLTTLVLSTNNFSGNLDPNKFSKLQNLQWLNLSNNRLVLSNNTVNYTLPQLRKLSLSSCNLSAFPKFLGTGENLLQLDLSNNQIRGKMPEWMIHVGNHSLRNLNLSLNFLTAIELLQWRHLVYADLCANSFQGSLPIPPPTIVVFAVSTNKFAGKIPPSFCNMSSLKVLDLSKNNLKGIIPPCIGKFSSKLSVLNLRMNSFHGNIPDTFTECKLLRSINLNSNELVGPLPRSLINCKMLEILDLGNNKISDSFPQWLGTLPKLQVLVLRFNRFHGPIRNPKTRFSFTKLRIIDLSHNEFTGPLPARYFQSFAALIDEDKNQVNLQYMGDRYYQDSMFVTMKGIDIELRKILIVFTTIDFSNNHFRGKIMDDIGKLKSLRGLNLSHNCLRGNIPSSLGNLTNLEWLDLSVNRLVGEIPTRLADLTYLAFLNLSQNQLIGAIPQGKQFNTFQNDSYDGNLGLCGFPLTKICNKNTAQGQSPSFFQGEDDSMFGYGFGWKVVLVGYASGMLLGVAIGNLVFLTGKPEWFIKMVYGRQYQRPKRQNRNAHHRSG